MATKSQQWYIFLYEMVLVSVYIWAGLDELIPHFEKNKYTNPELWERLTHKDFETMGLHAGTMAKFRRFMNQPEFQRGTSVKSQMFSNKLNSHILLNMRAIIFEWVTKP